MKSMTASEFAELAKTSQKITVFREIAADRLTPVGMFESLAEEMKTGVMLESGLHEPGVGRYSFLYFDPMASMSLKDQLTEDPRVKLREFLVSQASTTAPGLQNFLGGAVGFVAYEGARYFEDLPSRHPSTDLPDFFFSAYCSILIFDHHRQTVLVSRVTEVGVSPEKSYQVAQEALQKTIDQLFLKGGSGQGCPPSSLSHPAPEVKSDLDDEAYQKLVERAQAEIIKGEIFQVVISRVFQTTYTVSPFDIYCALRRVSPAPYMFYFPMGDTVVVGASPECLVKVEAGEVSVHAIAGTRPRPNAAAEAGIEVELQQDPKEVAEHMMLVDLARNDVGRVSVPGSVEVKNLKKIKHYSHVSHMTTEVRGKIAENLDAIDVFAGIFPAGTLTGAPKIRAMEIIDELEISARGLYGGAICRIDGAGNFDSCIAIRMALLKQGIASIRTGAGIVYDSQPSAEAAETRQKAAGMLAALALAEGASA